MPLFLDGVYVRHVKRHRYLGLIDDRVSWRPVVADAMAVGRRVLSILRKMRGQIWGGLQESQLLLYRGLQVSR